MKLRNLRSMICPSAVKAPRVLVDSDLMREVLARRSASDPGLVKHLQLASRMVAQLSQDPSEEVSHVDANTTS